MLPAHITGQLVLEIENALAGGVSHERIGEQLDVTPYVVGVIAIDLQRNKDRRKGLFVMRYPSRKGDAKKTED